MSTASGSAGVRVVPQVPLGRFVGASGKFALFIVPRKWLQLGVIDGDVTKLVWLHPWPHLKVRAAFSTAGDRLLINPPRLRGVPPRPSSALLLALPAVAQRPARSLFPGVVRFVEPRRVLVVGDSAVALWNTDEDRLTGQAKLSTVIEGAVTPAAARIEDGRARIVVVAGGEQVLPRSLRLMGPIIEHELSYDLRRHTLRKLRTTTFARSGAPHVHYPRFVDPEPPPTWRRVIARYVGRRHRFVSYDGIFHRPNQPRLLLYGRQASASKGRARHRSVLQVWDLEAPRLLIDRRLDQWIYPVGLSDRDVFFFASYGNVGRLGLRSGELSTMKVPLAEAAAVCRERIRLARSARPARFAVFDAGTVELWTFGRRAPDCGLSFGSEKWRGVSPALSTDGRRVAVVRGVDVHLHDALTCRPAGRKLTARSIGRHVSGEVNWVQPGWVTQRGRAVLRLYVHQSVTGGYQHTLLDIDPRSHRLMHRMTSQAENLYHRMHRPAHTLHEEPGMYESRLRPLVPPHQVDWADRKGPLYIVPGHWGVVYKHASKGAITGVSFDDGKWAAFSSDGALWASPSQTAVRRFRGARELPP